LSWMSAPLAVALSLALELGRWRDLFVNAIW
jgi:hypothetical protein